MKKAITILLVGLLTWNVVLTTQLSDSQKRIETLENQSSLEIPNTEYDPDRVTVIEDDTIEIQDIVNQVSPAVVTIISQNNQQTIGSGSGVIYASKDNTIWIVTNDHVIEDGTNFKILLQNSDLIDAQLIGSDALSDLAVLKAEYTFTQDPITFGNSDNLVSGQTVLAIGSPAGENFAGTVTKGIISGTNRILSVDTDRDGSTDWDMVLVQTDAAINPGNSGGALVNLNGELIGINTIKIAADNYEGMGFAIPSNEVINIISQLEADGTVERPQLGVQIVSLSEINQWTKNALEISGDQGIYIRGVENGSIAQQSGIQVGDIITKVNDELITSFSQFRRMIYSQETMNMTIIRGSEEVTIEVKLQ